MNFGPDAASYEMSSAISPPSKRQSAAAAKRWLDQLVHELDAIAKSDDATNVLGANVRWTGDLQVCEPIGWKNSGWYVEAADVSHVKGVLEIWLDRYLDEDGDPNLGVWYVARSKDVRSVADAIGVAQQNRYAWAHRSSDGKLLDEFAHREQARINGWILDHWTATQSYMGKYVVASPLVQDTSEVVGKVCGALRALADAASFALGAEPSLEQSGGDDTQAAERYWTLVGRLARPNQARFRNELLEHFDSKCAVTGHSNPVVLDAAHITAVNDDGDDRLENGLLLRADLHRLFDAGLLTISADENPMVVIARCLLRSQYGELGGRKLVVRLTTEQCENLARRSRLWTEDGIQR
jgi:HNH endonuclease